MKCLIENLNVLHENRLKQRAYFIPFGNYGDCKASNNSNARSLTSRRLALNGDWKFKYYNSPFDVPEEISKSPIKDGDIIPVPSCWQLYGYEKNHYVNVNFPFPAEPPFVPNDNPVGIYEREFNITEEIKNKKNRIIFEGVNSAFELYINGEYAGYSEGSHLHSEFDINSLLVTGTNRVTVIVYKWSKSSYIECQDMFRYSGIIRDVYLLMLEDTHLEDCYFTTTPLDEDNWELDIVALANGKGGISAFLEEKGCCIAETGIQRIENKNRFNIKINSPKLWSAEAPNLYRLFINIYDKNGNICECSSFDVGFKNIQIKKNIFYLNDSPIKIRGVNRHESYPGMGQAVSYETMVEDIKLMKRANINTVRTSHYQPDCRWLELCNIYGLYVIDEADLENHGSIYMHEGTNYFAKSDDWTKMYLDRMERMVLRDRNQPCIIMWSLGNESGNGKNHDKMAQLSRAYDNTKPIQYEGTWSRSKEDPLDGYDVISNMYTSPEDVAKILKKAKKPYYLCEYLHAMGTGPGNFKEYWDLIYSNPGFIGGCVWEWCDHGIMHEDNEGNFTYTYGGDHKEFPHDGNFCCDGLVSPHRKPHPSYFEMMHAYRPVHATWSDKSSFSIKLENRLNFISTLEFNFSWQLIQNGSEIKSGNFEKIDINPGENKEINIPIKKENLQKNAEYFVNIITYNPQKTLWSDSGYILSIIQLPLTDLKLYTTNDSKSNKNNILTSETKRNMIITGNEFKAVFDKKYGTFSSLCYNDIECIDQSPDNFGFSEFSEPIAGFRLNFWRAPTDNDMHIKNEWFQKRYDKLWTRISNIEINKNETFIKLTVTGSITPVSFSKILDFKNQYTVFNDGHILISSKIKPYRDDLIKFPCFGMILDMPKSFEKISYYGLGPGETYPDFKECARIGLYDLDVSDMHTQHIKPQESGNREETRYVAIYNKEGKGAVFCSETPFSFKAHHFSAEDVQNASHNEKLTQKPLTQVWINHKMGGLGSQSCGFQTLDEYSVLPKNMEYSFAIYPFNSSVSTPEDIWEEHLKGK